MRKLLCLITLVLVPSAFADVLNLNYEPGDKKTPASASVNGIALPRLGTGIRQKRIIINIDVYRASLFASSPSLFSRSIEGKVALDSLKGSDAYALHLQFMRDVKASDVLKSFNEALTKNGVKETPALKEFKDAIIKGGDLKKGSSISLSVDAKKGVLICEQGKSTIEIKGDAQLFRDIFSIWLGEASDLGLKNLKKALISG